ncbi:iron-siderophore ABC transporter substrate-binding protein [Aquipuribacter nitratireducens]|uniref:Iron-siderophore ABC transporter substrate-binding protein n=1 Tax=Aquipuribacter nitratireducens TaxID=650104 RepID=A0ABW0GQU5_9MICO
MTPPVDRRRPRPAHAALALAAPLLLTACGSTTADDDASAGAAASPGASAATFAFEHSAGTTDVPLDPQRIVTTTDQNALLPLLELGVTPVASAGLVGDDGEQSFRRVEGYDTSGVEFVGAYGEPNLEAVAAQRPDLIVGYEFDETYEEYSQMAPTVLVQIFDRPLTEALLDIGRLVGEEDQAQQRLEGYEARIADLQQQLEPVRDELSVSVLTTGDAGQFYRGDDGQAVGTVMADLDLLRPDPQSQPYESGEYSLEQVPAHDADVVVVLDFSGEAGDPTLQAFLDAPLVQGLAASQADQLHVVDGTATVGAAWGKMAAFLDELERVLVTEQPDPDVVAE